MADPVSNRTLFPGVDLRDGERLLWEGRPGFGVSRWERWRILKGFLSVGATGTALLFGYFFLVAGSSVVSRGSLQGDPRAWLLGMGTMLLVSAVMSFVLTGIVCGGIYLGKLSRSSPLSSVVVLVCAPLAVLIYMTFARKFGVLGAFPALLSRGEAICFWILAAPMLPALAHVARTVLRALHTRYYLTDQRYFEVLDRGGGPRVVRQGILPRGWIQVRAIPLKGGERGHLAIGTGRERVLLPFVDHPKQVVEEIRREMGAPSAPELLAQELVLDADPPGNGEGEGDQGQVGPAQAEGEDEPQAGQAVAEVHRMPQDPVGPGADEDLGGVEVEGAAAVVGSEQDPAPKDPEQGDAEQPAADPHGDGHLPEGGEPPALDADGHEE